MPSTLWSSSDMEPASAVTSPSLTIDSGTPNSCRRRWKSDRTSPYRSRGTARNREATRTVSFTYTPAELPPIASRRGRCAAAVSRAVRISR